MSLQRETDKFSESPHIGSCLSTPSSCAWILVGPTATGKTAVSNELARRLGADVLSADSMLVYRGMDIGTAKPTAAECAGLEMHGVDVVGPDETFNVGIWLEAARAGFESAARKGRDLVVAGGTGFYVNALLRGIDAPPAEDPARREELAALFASGGIEALRDTAETLSPGSVATLSDASNPRRVMRLIEKLKADPASVPPAGGVECRGSVVAGLHVEPAVLERRIVVRVAKMFEMGLLDEVAGLRAKYPNFSDTAGKGIGYAEAIAELDGELSQAEAVGRMVVRTRQLAKRQRTWFRHQLNVEWVSGPVDESDVARAADDVLEVWKRNGKSSMSW